MFIGGINLKKSMKRVAAVFLSIIMIVTLMPLPEASASNLLQYSSTDAKDLGFKPADAVMDDTKSVLYLTDMANKRVVAYNYMTNQSSYVQFNLQPEHIAIAENQLYVTLLNGPHNPQSSVIQPGEVAVIDTASFDTQVPAAKEQFAIDIEPYGITVDNKGYIYVSGMTSGCGTEIKSYSPDTQKEISSQLYCLPGKLLFNSYNNVIYNTGYTGYGSTYLDIYAYPINNGIIGKEYEYKDENAYETNPDIILSPDGKFLCTSSTEILTCSKDMTGDLLNYRKLSPTGKFNGMAFNMDDNVFYGGNTIYDYDSLMSIGEYSTNHDINKLFYRSDKLIALTADFTGPTYIETLDTVHITRPPVLVTTSVEDGEMNLPLINDLSLDFDQNINIANPNIVEVTDAQNNLISVTTSVQDNKLDVRFNNGLSYGQVYTLKIRGGYGNITGKSSGIEYPDDIILNFSTGSQDTLNENVKQYIGSNKLINGEKSYEGDLTVGLKNTLAVDADSTLNVKGDLIVYGGIVNYGTINVSGSIYILNQSELNPYSRQSTIGNLHNEGSITGTIDINSYPKPFMTMTPDTDTIQDKNKQTFGVITYPGDSILQNGQVYQSEAGMYTDIYYQLRSGNNDVKIGVEDILSNKNEKEININCTLPAPKIIGISPDNIQLAPMPVNPKIILKLDMALDSVSTAQVFTITDNKTKAAYKAAAQVKSDENGLNNELVLSTGYGVLPALSDFTLNIPYDSVISKDGIGLDKDYSITFSTDSGIKRLAGQDRYLTAVEISKEGWDTANNVILATGEAFPDALCAAPLARKYDAPILLTESKSLNPEVFNEIKRLKAQNIYIVGGTGAVSTDIEKTLTSSGLNCKRLQGKSRYETSVAIANEVGDTGTFIIATGNNFPDALSIAPLAAEMQAPILLTDNSNMYQYTRDFINSYEKIYENDTKTIVVGGTGIISDALLKSLPNAERFGGSDRYCTNYKINSGIQWYNYGVNNDQTHVFFATGANFPDALAGSILAANMDSRIVLADKNMNLNDSDIRNFLKQYINSSKMKYILGGTGVVPDNVIDNLINLK